MLRCSFVAALGASKNSVQITWRALNPSLVRRSEKYDKKFNAMATNREKFRQLTQTEEKCKDLIMQPSNFNRETLVLVCVCVCVWLICSPWIRDSLINCLRCVLFLFSIRLHARHLTDSFSLLHYTFHLGRPSEFRAVARITPFVLCGRTKTCPSSFIAWHFVNICIMKSHPISCLSI